MKTSSLIVSIIISIILICSLACSVILLVYSSFLRNELDRMHNKTFCNISASTLERHQGNISTSDVQVTIQSPATEVNQSTVDSQLSDSREIHRSKKNKTLEEIRKLRRNILKSLKISKPKKAPQNVVVPKFMKDLYKLQVDKNDEEVKKRANRTREEKLVNYIRSVKLKINDIKIARSGTRITLKATIDGKHFNNQSIRKAELRLFYRPNLLDQSSSSISEVPHRIEIRQSKCGSKCQKKILDVAYIEATPQPMWVLLNVTEAKGSPGEDSKLHFTFDIDYVIDDKGIDNNDLLDIEVYRSLKKSIENTIPVFTDDVNFSPHLLIYSDSAHSRRQRQETKKVKNRKSRTKRTIADPRKEWNNLTEKRRQRPAYQKHCRRKPLYVDFVELGWQDWIVAPSGFNAYMCEGSCTNNANLNAIDHATIRKRLLSDNPSMGGAPVCCVATQLSSYPLLIVESDSVVLANFKDMVVEACGCR